MFSFSSKAHTRFLGRFFTIHFRPDLRVVNPAEFFEDVHANTHSRVT